VRVLYTFDGLSWHSATLNLEGDTYKAKVRVALKGQGVFAYPEAGDAAGNVTIRVVDQGMTRLALPIIRR